MAEPMYADEYDSRLAALEERERQVAQRERDVEERERRAERKMQTAQEALDEQAEMRRHAPNWPPCLPKKLIYQNFEEEIPTVLRARVEVVYWHTMGLLLAHTHTHTRTAKQSRTEKRCKQRAQHAFDKRRPVCKQCCSA